MQDMRTRRVADIVQNHHLVFVKMKMKINKHWKTRETALQKFNTDFFQHTDKLNEFEDKSQQQVPRFTGSSEIRRNHDGEQLGRGHCSANFIVSGDSGSQEASSQGMDLYRKPG
ncbi:unnamed protein product [Schistosoma margrebowiei]|uniref:Uncharacterized protein n=1 Tax=Schistosoma margrebowiei TaxID=48269 RepID=A0A183MSA8_9TREM|nr:unnamed protein product [Schistosoma margrebowiei]